jgi:glycerol uptake facilitator-like aquaporin
MQWGLHPQRLARLPTDSPCSGVPCRSQAYLESAELRSLDVPLRYSASSMTLKSVATLLVATACLIGVVYALTQGKLSSAALCLFFLVMLLVSYRRDRQN